MARTPNQSPKRLNLWARSRCLWKMGFGAYAEPVAKAAKSFGPPQILAEHIMNGHPVIVWGYYLYSTPVKYAWKTEAGKDIFGYRGEPHASCIRFCGKVCG